MNDKTYDILKRVALIVVPALATFVNAVGIVWGIPYTNEVTATITAFGVFLGAAIGISSKNYEPETHGNLVVTKHNDVYADFTAEPSNLKDGDTIILKVSKPTE
nr:MAG TPA: holin [Caudoviricetes sp.]